MLLHSTAMFIQVARHANIERNGKYTNMLGQGRSFSGVIVNESLFYYGLNSQATFEFQPNFG